MTTGRSAADFPIEALHAQLFRYAQDLETLIQQQYRLQRHHQTLLEALGRDVQSSDQIPMLLGINCPLTWVTDPRGTLLEISEDLCAILGEPCSYLSGRNVADLVDHSQATMVRLWIDRFFTTGDKMGGVMLSVTLRRSQGEGALPLSALVMQTRQLGNMGTRWYFQPDGPGQTTPLAIQAALLQNISAEHGVLVTAPDGTIYFASAGYEQLCGYTNAELVGRNPRYLSSGRHNASFFEDFWRELLDTGNWNGAMFNRRKDGQIYLKWQAIKRVENTAGEVVSYIAAVTDLTRGDEANAELTTLAFHDPLTGLPNRRSLMDTFSRRIGEAGAQGFEISVLFMDLDRFKPINDELGHDVGDGVLQQVALRLQAVLDPGDFAARVGGDEFVVLLCGPQRAPQASTLATALQRKLRETIQVGHHKVSVGVSIGCACYPGDGSSMVDLLNRADDAMYHAKRLGLPFSRYDNDAVRLRPPNLNLDIWKAIELAQLQLTFQPQVSTDGSGRLRGCEVLARWMHPVAGDIAAETFIPIAEKNGAIVPIGKWVLSRACAYLAQWRAQGLSDFTLSVNISLRQLRDRQFSSFVRTLLNQHALPPGCLELEFSESDTLLFHGEDTQCLQALRDLGVRLSIDDFGASFSSLARLSSLSISELKINSQFVQELEAESAARSISQTLLAVGQILNIDVIAQGVESARQAYLLNAQGCKVMQGFYAGQPMSPDTFSRYLQEKK